jgi:hypothetical protein
MSNSITMTGKMDKEILSLVKIYIGSVLDIALFGIAAWEGLDHGLRTVSAAGAIVLLFFLIRKHILDYRVKKIEEEIKRGELEKQRIWFEEKYGNL